MKNILYTRTGFIVIGPLLAALLGGCQIFHTSTIPHQTGSAYAVFTNSQGERMGRAALTQGPFGLLLKVELQSVPPGWHGIHFHEIGNCGDTGIFKHSGGHIGKLTGPHGLLNAQGEAHGGDLPNIFAHDDGVASAEFYTHRVSLFDDGSGKPSLNDSNGTALVMHAAADDHRSSPIGGAGKRIACGVIKVTAN